MISVPAEKARGNGSGPIQARGDRAQEVPAAIRPADTAGIVAVIPAHNESRFIGSVVLKARQCANVVVVVDDGSTDTTAEIADLAGAIVIRHDRNQGKGAALNTGLARARTLAPSVVVLLDGDGQHLPEEMDRVLEPILSGRADIVVGSRYLDGRSRVPWPRVFGHWIFNSLTNGASGVALTDSQSGYRAFSPRALEEISFRSNGFSVESEMQFIASEHRLRMVEVPITVEYADRPKRSVVSHGLLVVNGFMRFVGQYRPLLFFGLPGLLVFMVGLGLGVWMIDTYSRTQTLGLGLVLVSILLGMGGMLCFFAGVILHSVRGLLLEITASLKS